MITLDALAAQEQCFARAFAALDVELARPLYHPQVIYLSPTVRLYDGWPWRIEGVEPTLDFIRLTISGLERIQYQAVEQAITPDGAAFVRIHFDFTRRSWTMRSSYVVIYRYRDGLIGQQELYYDPSGRFEVIGAVA